MFIALDSSMTVFCVHLVCDGSSYNVEIPKILHGTSSNVVTEQFLI